MRWIAAQTQNPWPGVNENHLGRLLRELKRQLSNSQNNQSLIPCTNISVAVKNIDRSVCKWNTLRPPEIEVKV